MLVHKKQIINTENERLSADPDTKLKEKTRDTNLRMQLNSLYNQVRES